MAIGWEKLANRCGISLAEINELRKGKKAPETRNIKDWLTYTAKLGKQEKLHLPGENTYDQAVKKGEISYTEAVAREKATEGILINKRRELDYNIKAGEYISVEQHRKELLRQQDALLGCLSALSEIASEDFVPAEKMKIRKMAKKWGDKIRRMVADELDKIK